MGPDPAIAAVRRAVRDALSLLTAPPESQQSQQSHRPPLEACERGPLEAGEHGPVLVACSGGADSLALAAALAFEAPRAGRRTTGDGNGGGIAAGGVTVDHGLQEGSAERAARVVRSLADLGLDPVASAAVTVDGEGGPEAAARHARYRALDELALRTGARAVLLGHTLDDQAETVLLGLARGSGARSLAGMPAAFTRGPVRYLRPLLGLTRATTRDACLAAGLEPWDDPHNDDHSFTRVRLRQEALPALRRALGPGVGEALARTARMLRDDADALDDWAERAYAEAAEAGGPAGSAVAEALEAGSVVAGAPEAAVPAVAGLDVTVLRRLPAAVRTRVLRRAAVEAGSPPGSLGAVHVEAMDRLVTHWHGQGAVDLPGRVSVRRRYGKLVVLKNTGCS